MHYFDKDVNESEQQERDHQATRGPMKQHTRACAKSTENQPIDLRDLGGVIATRGVIASATGASEPRQSHEKSEKI